MVICTSWKHDPVRPDVEIKSSPIFAKTCPKSGDGGFYLRYFLFKMVKNSPNSWATLVRAFFAMHFQKSPNLDALPHW